MKAGDRVTAPHMPQLRGAVVRVGAGGVIFVLWDGGEHPIGYWAWSLRMETVTAPRCSCGGELIDVDRQPRGQAQMVLACKPAKVWAKCAECGKRVTVLASLRWSLRGPS